jgi:probable HAF family extracellular repeat protein
MLVTTLFALAITAPGLAQEESQVADSVAGKVAAKQHHHYTLIDMGTFGGTLSGINEPSNYVPAVNRRGQTVGFSGDSEPLTVLNNPAACFGITTVSHAFEWKNNVVTDLGSLAGAAFCSDADSINDRGEIEGLSEIDVIDPLFGWNEMRAVVWKHGQIMNLGTLGGNNSWAFGINNSGQAVGLAQNAVPDPYSIFDFVIFGSSGGTQTRAFLWQNGIMQDLGTLGGPDAWAGGINVRGQIAGQSYVNSTPNLTTGFPTLDPFFWNKGKMRDLGSLGGVVGFVAEINNRGQIIGGSSTNANPSACYLVSFQSIEFGNPGCDPYFWDGGEMIDLSTHTTGAVPNTSHAINDAGEIVGAATFPDQPYDAYLRREDSRAIDLGHVSGDCFSEAWAVNIHSQVVGDSFSCGSTFQHAAFLWEDGSIADLNTLIASGSSLQLVFATAINDRGEIAGEGVPPGVSPGDVFTLGHAFLLIPCDEGHPDIEGCDYSLDMASAAQRRAVASQSHQVPKELLQKLYTRRFGTRRP